MGTREALGSERNPLRVAIVGSGPGGFYSAQALFRADIAVRIDMLDRLPTPFGLVRGGVAPDHPKIKEASLVYESIAETPEFAFFGNVTVGRDVGVEELRDTHHVVIFACGAEVDRELGIPGEDLPASHTATEFVGWYNGHPDYRERVFDLSCETAVVIGQGNVAADVARILAMPVDDLKHTDVAEHALLVLAENRLREIHVVGRRGPVQAKFTTAELRELGEIAECDPVVEEAVLALNPESQAEVDDKRGKVAAKNLGLFEGFASRPAATGRRRLHFDFLESPTELVGEGRLEGVVLARNRLRGEPFAQVSEATVESRVLPCGILFRSVGYRGVPIPGVPFDDCRGIFPHRDGRLVDGDDILPGLYAAGWIKRGPSGIIGTNKPDAGATVKGLLEDIPRMAGGARAGGEGLQELLAERGVRRVSYGDWRKIDAAEVARGKARAKPREKFTTIEEMLAVLD
ncbi:MAG: NADP oxidoreductase [Rhodospirillales bacterium]|nr:NADP oxidoreductase [Rhodospirillales bacterium]